MALSIGCCFGRRLGRTSRRQEILCGGGVEVDVKYLTGGWNDRFRSGFNG